jgi:putative holliday junction resolvase
MQILGIDYGRSKIGIAVGDADSKLAEPYIVLRYKTIEEVIGKVVQIVSAYPKVSEDEKVEQVVVGVSEGEMARETRKFGEMLQEKLEIPVVYHDETLSTQDAQELSIKAGIRRKKRKGMEDAFAASVVLQDYLDKL